MQLYRIPGGSAEQQAVAWANAGRAADSALISKIADQPAAKWFGDWDPNITADVNALVTDAANAGQLPVLVAYNIPGRDCGNFSAGGAQSSAAYLDWINRFAVGLAGRPAVIILEPDAVAQAVFGGCLTSDQVTERFADLRSAVQTLSADPKVKVYLDAGNSGWGDKTQMITALRLAGAETAWGLAVNVANFYRTDESIAYGMALSAALHGRHIVVDTSRNGNGAYTGSYSPAWCNPPGRALGVSPTTKTGQPFVDAYLWIKNPGESDGECQHGDPPAGTWWPDYALRLAAGSS
jgi:endoglucanase